MALNLGLSEMSRTRERPIPPPEPPPIQADIDRKVKIPPLPPEWEYLREIIEHEYAIRGIIRDALEMYCMTIAMFGSPMWSDRRLAETLAWGYMAGFPECTALSGALNVVLTVATFRFGIRGGCMPRLDLLEEHVAPRVRELALQGQNTPWLDAWLKSFHLDESEWRKIDFSLWEPDVLTKGIFKIPVVERPARTRTPL